MSVPAWLQVSDEVAAALAERRGVVALESSLIAQGLPVPHNLETAVAAEAAVREAGAVPATVAIEDGRVVVGADRELLERLADPDRTVAKAGSRDLGPLLARSGLASTTVCSSSSSRAGSCSRASACRAAGPTRTASARPRSARTS